MAQFNFGQQISGALGQAFQNQQRTEQFAKRFQRLVEQDQFNRKMQRMAQRLAERQEARQQEAQERALVNDAFARMIERQEQKRDQAESDALIGQRNASADLAEARTNAIKNADEEESGGMSPNTFVSMLQSVINATSSQASRTSREKEDLQDELEDTKEKIRETEIQMPEKREEAGIFSSGNAKKFDRFKRQLESLRQDSSRLATEIDSLDSVDSELSQKTNQLIETLLKFGGVKEPSKGGDEKESGDIPVINQRSDLSGLVVGDIVRLGDSEDFNEKYRGKRVEITNNGVKILE